MGKGDNKCDGTTVEVTGSGTTGECKTVYKLPSCSIILKQFLSSLANGQVYNPSIVFNPKIKIYLDEKYLHETTLFFDMQKQADSSPQDTYNNIVFNHQFDLIVPSFRSILTFELYDRPIIQTMQYISTNEDVKVDMDIFISAVKLNIGYLIPGKFYNLILQFTGNLNPTIYDCGDILTNIQPNEVSCSQCKVCNLFNYITTHNTTKYYHHCISSDYLVEPSPMQMNATANTHNSCNCVQYSQINKSNACLTCIIPCCSHRFSNYVSVAIKLNSDILKKDMLLKLPQLVKPVVAKSELSPIDHFLHLLQESELVYAKLNYALNKILRISSYTFLQVFLCTILIFPGNVMSVILLYIGILFIVLSISADTIKDTTSDFTAYCINCLDQDNKISKIKYKDIYKHTTCMKCLHLKKYSEINTLKNFMIMGNISIGNFMASKLNPLLELLLEAIDVLKVFMILSRLYGKVLGSCCLFLAFIMTQMRTLRSTLYYISIVIMALIYSGFNVNFAEPFLAWIRVAFCYIAFVCKRWEFNKRIHWHS